MSSFHQKLIFSWNFYPRQKPKFLPPGNQGRDRPEWYSTCITCQPCPMPHNEMCSWWGGGHRKLNDSPGVCSCIYMDL